jgi:hypothetical protein
LEVRSAPQKGTTLELAFPTRTKRTS